MNPKEILELLRRRPFEPFRVVTTDGTGYEIFHPELVVPMARSVFIAIGGRASNGAPESFVIVSYIHVQRLDSIAVSQT